MALGTSYGDCFGASPETQGQDPSPGVWARLTRVGAFGSSVFPTWPPCPVAILKLCARGQQLHGRTTAWLEITEAKQALRLSQPAPCSVRRERDMATRAEVASP